MCIEGEDIVFDLILTKSGHYVLPLDAFKENMVKGLNTKVEMRDYFYLTIKR